MATLDHPPEVRIFATDLDARAQPRAGRAPLRCHWRAVAASTIITAVDICTAPDPTSSPALALAYAQSRAREEAHLFAHITRLGRLFAQEALADALGLTVVHVNRTLRGLRRDGSLTLQGRELVSANPAALARNTGRPFVG